MFDVKKYFSGRFDGTNFKQTYYSEMEAVCKTQGLYGHLTGDEPRPSMPLGRVTSPTGVTPVVRDEVPPGEYAAWQKESLAWDKEDLQLMGIELPLFEVFFLQDTIHSAYTQAFTRDGKVLYRKNGKFISRLSIPREILVTLDASPASPPPEDLSPRASARRDLFDATFRTCPSSPSLSPSRPQSPTMSEPSGPSGESASPQPTEMTLTEMVQGLMKTVAQQTQTIAQLTALSNAASTAQASPSIPVATPTVPAFVSTPAPQYKSLFDAFPFTDAALLLDITRHELRPMDLRKLDSKLRAKADDEGNLASFNSRDSAGKDYPSLASVIRPLGLYFQVLIHFASSGGQLDVVTVLSSGMVQYLVHLTNLNQRYEWDAVRQYHMDYHALRRHEMMNSNYSGWGKPEAELVTEYLLSQERKTVSSLTSSKSSTPAKRLPIEQQICHAFNWGSCSNNPCKRIHQCSTVGCGSKDHPEASCPKKAKQ
ncbi:hypothetical protein AAF712_011525 [Marasmius tenuissimus]|uniref:C3H1-type domain-containing protein n=1 Tax=Marasmius tenuissimus TaxID=585030 RepID=A0ABR2ZLK8_9AGAR